MPGAPPPYLTPPPFHNHGLRDSAPPRGRYGPLSAPQRACHPPRLSRQHTHRCHVRQPPLRCPSLLPLTVISLISHHRKSTASSKVVPRTPFAASVRRSQTANISPPHIHHGATGTVASSCSTSYPCNILVHSLHVTYRRLIPAIEVSSHSFATRAPYSSIIQIEILPAGEHGPRRLDNSTTMNIKGIPFLTLSEFVRDKLKAWAMQVPPHLSARSLN